MPRNQSINVKNVIKTLTDQKLPLNLGLFFEKCTLWYEERGKRKCGIGKQFSLLRKDEILRVPFHLVPVILYENYGKRFENLIDSLEDLNYKTKKLELKPIWRLVINLGAASVYETSLLFHRNYAVPIIPGSAVKGVTHHYAEEYGKSSEDEIAKIFGTQDKKGEVIFFDALPVIDRDRDFIVLDVMNVHYRDYYQDEKGKTPGDWMNPNPVFFLTVEGIRFRFTVASKDEKLAERATELLKEVLLTIGIGAKTSAGYGYFE
jgi:CRISPR-associated protein Cmr6